MKSAYRAIAESLGVAIRELRMKAAVLENIQGALHHQASDSLHPDVNHSVNPENLFEIIKGSISHYLERK
jgi:hypothetical protein